MTALTPLQRFQRRVMDAIDETLADAALELDERERQALNHFIVMRAAVALVSSELPREAA